MVELIVGFVTLCMYVIVRVLGASQDEAVKEAKTIKSIMKNK